MNVFDLPLHSQTLLLLSYICCEYFLPFSFIQDAIRMMVTQANNHLEELKKSLALAGS